MRAISAFVLICFGACVRAQALTGDALVCETEEPLALLAEEKITLDSGSAIMKRVEQLAQLSDLAAQFNQVLGGLAAKEQAIHQDSRSPNRGATSSRITTARAEERKSMDSGRRYTEFTRRCTSTTAPQQAEVIERRPISGTVRIRTQYRGKDQEFWTTDNFVQ